MGNIQFYNNKVLFTGNDKVAMDAACCCIEYGNDCEFCDAGKTPKYFTVWLSGIEAGVVACLNCDNPGSIGNHSISLDNIGPHLLTQTGGDPCFWTVAGIGSWSWTYYNNDDCTGASSPDSGTFDLALKRTEAGWWFMIDGGPGFKVIFEGTSTETADDDCINVAAISNANVAPYCDAGGYKIVSDTGSATFEAGDQT